EAPEGHPLPVRGPEQARKTDSEQFRTVRVGIAATQTARCDLRFLESVVRCSFYKGSLLLKRDPINKRPSQPVYHAINRLMERALRCAVGNEKDIVGLQRDILRLALKKLFQVDGNLLVVSPRHRPKDLRILC